MKKGFLILISVGRRFQLRKKLIGRPMVVCFTISKTIQAARYWILTTTEAAGGHSAVVPNQMARNS